MKGKDEWSCFRTSRQVEIASLRKVVDEPTRSTTKFVFIRLPAESSSSCTRFLWRMAVPVVLVGKIISSPCEPQRQGWRERRQSVALLSRHVSLVWDLHWENNHAFQYLRAYKYTRTQIHTHTESYPSWKSCQPSFGIESLFFDEKSRGEILFPEGWLFRRRSVFSYRIVFPSGRFQKDLCVFIFSLLVDFLNNRMIGD